MEVFNYDTLYIILSRVIYDDFYYSTKHRLKTVSKQFYYVVKDIPGARLLNKKYNRIDKIVARYSGYPHTITHKTSKDLRKIYELSTNNKHKARISLILGNTHYIEQCKSLCIMYPWLAIGYGQLDLLVRLVDMGSTIKLRYDKCLIWACMSNNLDAIKHIILNRKRYHRDGTYKWSHPLEPLNICIRKRNSIMLNLLILSDNGYVKDIKDIIFSGKLDQRSLSFLIGITHGYFNFKDIFLINHKNTLFELFGYVGEDMKLHIMDKLCVIYENTKDQTIMDHIQSFINTNGYMWLYSVTSYHLRLCEFLVKYKLANYNDYKNDLLLVIASHSINKNNFERMSEYDPYVHKFIELYRTTDLYD